MDIKDNDLKTAIELLESLRKTLWNRGHIEGVTTLDSALNILRRKDGLLSKQDESKS